MSYERALLQRLLDIHDMHSKRLTDDYDAVRKIRRQEAATFEEARQFLARPEGSLVAKPVTPAGVLIEQAKPRRKNAARH